MSLGEVNLEAAEKIAVLLAEFEIEVLVIGAIAMAAHSYPRFTHDLDLGINCDQLTLPKVDARLREEGFHTSLHRGGIGDPLSGLIDLTGHFGQIQLINFGDTFPAVIRDGLICSSEVIWPETSLKVAPLSHLIVLKLYAGGTKSLADIIELLKRNPDQSFEEIKELCAQYRLRGLQSAFEEIESAIA